jgi:PAS domain S-box-containing protein
VSFRIVCPLFILTLVEQDNTMNETRTLPVEERVLVMAPHAADVALSRQILTEAGLDYHVCSDVGCLCRELEQGAGAVLLTEEVLAGEESESLVQLLQQQPPWSDLPVFLLTDHGADAPVGGTAMERLGNITLLERSARLSSLASALRTAVRTRRRQYQFRDQIETLARFQAALKGSPILVFRQDRDLRHTWIFNPGLSQSEADVIGKTDGELFPPQDSGPLIAIKQRVLTTGVGCRKEVVLHHEGKPVYYDLTVEPLRDSAETVVGITCAATDVTRSKALQAERDWLLQRLRLHIERLPLAYVPFDVDDRVLDWNPAAQRIFGYAREEVLGRVWPDLILNLPMNESLQEVVQRLRRGDMEAHSVNENRTKDGRTITCEWFNTPLVDPDGQYMGVISLAQDITERKRAEQALEQYATRLQALSRRLLEIQEKERRHLARELHDEFGQVLATINFHLHAAKKLAGEAARLPLDECSTLLQQAGEQVRSLALELRPNMLDVLGLEATLRWLTQRHQQRTDCKIQIQSNLSGESLSSDVAVACFRVVQESLTNVARHAQARHVVIELGKSESVLELAIGDDGVGFDVCSTQEQAAQRGCLGLLGMRERVQILGGNLVIDSSPGHGTCICASFPLGVSPRAPAEPVE